jgi:hypothetical protein
LVAHQYTGRGAKVCLVGRRAAQLDQVVKECRDMSHPSGALEPMVVGVVADFSNVDDTTRVRSKVENGEIILSTTILGGRMGRNRYPHRCHWSLPLMAGERKGKLMEQATPQNIQHAVDVAAKAATANYVGPLVAAVTFVRQILQRDHTLPLLMVDH